MYYRAFNHVEFYERAIALKIFFAASDVLPRQEYGESDAYIWNPLDPAWREISSQVADIQRVGEINGTSPAEVARQVHAVADPFIAEILARPEVQALNSDAISASTTIMDDGRTLGEWTRHAAITMPSAAPTASCFTTIRWFNARTAGFQILNL